jgi:hypothetical protein
VALLLLLRLFPLLLPSLLMCLLLLLRKRRQLGHPQPPVTAQKRHMASATALSERCHK